MANYPEVKIENYDPILDQVMTASEANELWNLPTGTVKLALKRETLTGRKSKGTWLVSRRLMEIVYGPQPPANVEEIYSID